MSGSRAFEPGYRRRLLRFVGRCLALMLLAATITYVVQVVRWTEIRLHPPRMPLERTPADVGIPSYEVVSFVTADGLTLQGWYVPSTNGAAVILGHGHMGNRQQLLPEAGILAQVGFGVLLFDWRAHGQSDGDLVTLGYWEKLDLEAALAFLVARPDVDPDRIGALGHSMGGAILAEVAAYTPQIRVVVVEAAFPTFEEVLDHQAGVLPGGRFLARLWGRIRTGIALDAVRPVDTLCDISPRPLLLIYGTQDRVVPLGSAQRMLQAACEPKELWLIEGAGHGNPFHWVPEAYERRLIDFFSDLVR